MDTPLRVLAKDLAEGRTTAREVAESCLAQLKAREQDIEAWVPFDHSPALARAESCLADGPLSGIPFGAKDIYDTAELPTEWGSEVYRGRQPEHDAALVAELKQLGAYVLAKTETTAFAFYDPAPTRNPHNLGHTPGGSSSGSAAAVSAGMVPLALGSQTQGSVLRPASFCGVVGFKPSRGVLPVEGMLPCSPTLDTAGLFTETVGDMRFVWEALRPGGNPYEALRFVVIGWPPHKRISVGMEKRLRSSVKKLEDAGLKVLEASGPPSFKALPPAIAAVMAYEAAQTHGERYDEYGERLGVKLAGLVEMGRSVSDAAYAEGLAVMQAAEQEFAAWAREDTVVITPAALGPAPKGLESTGDPACNAPWTAIGAAAISIPCGTVGRMPLGLQLTAPAGGDAMLLRTAETVEQALSV
ncbi:MAG: amidase [Acidobacteria bacterium]|nr:amidase [Acidobacteriota bacterium]MDA1233192.1 amidase [Acidobacteriota bacterium]